MNYFKKPYSVVKIDVSGPAAVVTEKQYTPQNQNEEFLPSEPVFVENPNAQSEDDGIVLTLVLSRQRDFLSVLDAKNMSEIARAELPDGSKGALTFHGFFADSKKFSKLNV